MTLSFSTQINGQASAFPERIIKGLLILKRIGLKEAQEHTAQVERLTKVVNPPIKAPKIHTIRADKPNRWRAGMSIHPVIFNRTPKRHQFAPTMTCVSTQKIEIYHPRQGKEQRPGMAQIIIDGRVFFDPHQGIDRGIGVLSLNDGFESIADFLDYFAQDFEGKIIHWTEIKY